MRVALISIAGQPCGPDGTTPAAVGGKSLARRQLEFALAAGCGRVLALGSGAAPAAIALRHAAEGAGAGFQAIPDERGLLGAIKAGEEVLVLAPGLLPEAEEALGALADGATVLTLPAGAGVAAGFERLDLERAWAGAAVVPGSLVERLAGLAPGFEPSSALMRAGVQARLPERRLPETALSDGSWIRLDEDAAVIGAERSWLARHLPPSDGTPVRTLSRHALRSLALPLLEVTCAAAALRGAVVALLGAALAVAAYGWPPAAFATVALAAVASEFASGLADLQAAPFARRGPSWRGLLHGAVDAALVGGAIFAIEGSWLHRAFPALVLLAALCLPARNRAGMWVRDRALLAAALAVAAALDAAEPAIMLVSLALLALHTAQTGARRG